MIEIGVRMGIGRLIRMRTGMKIGTVNEIGICIGAGMRVLIENRMKIEMRFGMKI